ncbi:MAG: hypothetical protein KZQ65_04710, partial [Candidatus Thiodiazotropha sp. (ex Gloverina cf. vestifex)]|nr:hypothetical protein [Candidatus Thiodiazotropha sp. (ex Gloverina cf. vestifex)]
MRFVGLFILSFILSTGMASDSFPEDDPFDRIDTVNDGQLEFLSTPPTGATHHHENPIRITSDSLLDGWVMLEQCHRNLDPVSLLEIVYHPQRIRKIHIVSSRNIGHSQVIDTGVEIRDIQADAELCLRAESRALHILEKDTYILRNGPYMRRFLDGYYPMRLQACRYLVKDFGTSESPKSTRQRDSRYAPT